MSRRTEDDFDEPTPRRHEPLTNTVDQEAAQWQTEARAVQAEHDAQVRRDER